VQLLLVESTLSRNRGGPHQHTHGKEHGMLGGYSSLKVILKFKAASSCGEGSAEDGCQYCEMAHSQDRQALESKTRNISAQMKEVSCVREA